MSFITPPGKWISLNTSVVGSTSQSFVTIGVPTTSQNDPPAVIVKAKIMSIGGNSYVAFTSMSALGSLTASGMYALANTYLDIDPLGLVGTNASGNLGVTIFPVSASKLNISYYTTIPVDWGRSY